MNNQTSSELDTLLRNVAETRGKLEAIEASWKIHRATSKAYALRLLIEYEFPLNRVHLLTGHERATLRTWLASAGVQSKG